MEIQPEPLVDLELFVSDTKNQLAMQEPLVEPLNQIHIQSIQEFGDIFLHLLELLQLLIHHCNLWIILLLVEEELGEQVRAFSILLLVQVEQAALQLVAAVVPEDLYLQFKRVQLYLQLMLIHGIQELQFL
jgi:hypothetical protein